MDEALTQLTILGFFPRHSLLILASIFAVNSVDE